MSKIVPVPNLVLSQRIVDKVISAAAHFIEDETGEAMIGVIMPGKKGKDLPTIYVLDTISPDANAPVEDTVREAYMFRQGGESQYEIFTWLIDNWEYQRKKRRGSYGRAKQAKWDAPLRHVGDWHKHPGYMITPSGGDLMTALDWLDDEGTDKEFLLVPILTVGHPATIDESQAAVNYMAVPMDDGTMMRVDWWYIHRDVRMFQPISPVIVPESELPGLTQYPWHLVNEQRAMAEFARIQDDGLFLSVTLWNADEELPLDVCLMMARQGGRKVIIVVTNWDFPETAPYARIAPFINMKEDETIYDVFEDMWKESESVAEPADWKWSKDKTLLDYVQAIEDDLGLRPEEPEVEVDATGENADESDDDDIDQSASDKLPDDEKAETIKQPDAVEKKDETDNTEEDAS